MWVKIAQLLLSLSLLVIIHEFGHFLFARLFKCRVEKFYLFFNPWFSLFKFKKGETEYGIGWVPFGGYVKISGMIDESMDTEQLKKPVQPYEFRAKPAWQRLLIMVGGVLMNVVLAIFIYIGISYAYGDAYISAKDAKYGFEFSELAREIGFRNGDKIVSVEGEPVDNYTDVILRIALDRAEYVDVERDGATVRVEINPSFMPRILKAKEFLAPRVPFVVTEVEPGGHAERGGILAGDTVVGVNGVQAAFTGEVFAALADNRGKELTLDIVRDSAGVRQLVSRDVRVSDAGKIGVALAPMVDLIRVSTKEYNLFSAVPAGFRRAGDQIGNYLKQLKLMFSPKTEAYKQVGGFIAIGNIFPDTWSWYSFWSITALLSIMLAVMNLLPIPALDGGHVMFLLYEVVTRRRPSDKFLEKAQMAGLFILLFLLLYANGNDVVKLFNKWFS